MRRVVFLAVFLLGGCGSAGGGGGAGAPDAAAGTTGGGAGGGSSGGGGPSGGGGLTATGGAAGAGGSAGALPLGGATGAGGASGALTLAVVSGNHQMVPEMYPAGEPMVIEARAGGAPAPGVTLSWKITDGWASIGKLETITDASGRSENTFIGNYVPPNVSFTKQKVTVTVGAAAAELGMTTCDTGSGAPVMPLAVLEAPAMKDAGSAKAGSTLPGAVQVRVVNQAGPYVGSALPGIGVRIDGPPGVRCKGEAVLTDDKGLATCNLEVGNQTGSLSFSVKVGGAVTYDGVQVEVTP
ncbi:MAG: hypothetical protein HYZ29_07750 [Myxococcales bacterium]|nr:hypothetical protein [Myxococcales bacterium]